nr:hypothetical protein [candidate division Zixibacteria bacterium]
MRGPALKVLAVFLACIALVVSIAFANSISVCKVERNTEYQPITTPAATTADSKGYAGRLRVYVVEPHSRWDDYNGNEYHFGFLGFAVNEEINLTGTEEYTKTASWTGTFESDNIMIIAALFNISESHPGQSDTLGGSAWPFDAYYSDAAAAAKPDTQWFNVYNANFTHTVFAEEGTATWCPSCPGMNTSMYQAYTILDHPFFYTAMVIDMNAEANIRMDDYNLHWVPSTYFDGGDEVQVGSDYYWNLGNKITACGAREVQTFGMSVEITSMSKGSLNLEVRLAQNSPPADPAIPTGETDGYFGVNYNYAANTTDVEENQCYYRFCWEEGDTTGWFGPYDSGTDCIQSHQWADEGTYNVKAQAKDSWGFESNWSDALSVFIDSFVYGDANGSGSVNILDATYLINYLYKSGPAPIPARAGDANCNGATNILDATYLINYLYKSGPAPC